MENVNKCNVVFVKVVYETALDINIGGPPVTGTPAVSRTDAWHHADKALGYMSKRHTLV